MENGGGGPATRAAGGMCDRLLTFLSRNLTMNRVRSIADGPSNGAGAGDGHPTTEGAEVEEDEFAIPIERAVFDDYEFGGHGDGGYSRVATTILEESAATTTTTTTTARRDDVPEPKAGADGKVAAEPAPPVAAVEETTTTGATTLERKKSLFKRRQASGVGSGDGEAPRRSGLRPRVPPPVLRVPTNINERSSTFIEQRRKSFGRSGKPAADK